MNYITEEMKQGPFFDYCFDKNRLKKWISKLYDETIGTEDVTIIKFIESLKTFGFNEATKAGISIGIDDLKIPPQKRKLLKKVESGTQLANDGLQNKTITPLENFQLTIDLWHKTNETIKNEVVTNFESTDTLNPVYMMAFSGARGNLSQVTQLLGMRGFMSDPEGQIIDFPIRSNFREGLTLTEYIISCYGARKGLVDTALRTADAGYLTRRLVDVAHTLVITVHDCNPKNPTWLSAIKENNKIIYSLEDRLVGRVLADNISINYLDKEKNKIVKEVWPYFKKYKQLSHLDAKLLGSCFKFVRVRSPLSCIQRHSLCQLCYGWTLPHSHLAPLGEAVGIIAAQSIGEPGTQLTMRTFHTGGVFSGALSDEILAPYSGIIEYDRAVIGAMFRLSNGKLGFLIQEPVTIQIKPPQNQSLIQPFFEMDLPPNSVLFLKNSEKVQKNQLLLELPKEKDDENETLLNEYSYYSKTSGLLKLEESHLKPSLNLLPFKNYKNKRLRGLKNTLKKEQKDLIQKQKLGFAYLPMQEQNQKYNSVKIYHGEICYATTLTTLPKVGDIVNQNSLVALSEFTHITETTLTNSIDYNKFKANKILKHHANSFLNLKLEKTIFNYKFNNIRYTLNSGYLVSHKKKSKISVNIQSLKQKSQNLALKIQLIANPFLTQTNGKILWSDKLLSLKEPSDTSYSLSKQSPNISTLVFWLSEPIYLNYFMTQKSKKIKRKKFKNLPNNFLLSKQKFGLSNLLKQEPKTINQLYWIKKEEVFSWHKTNQGLFQPQIAKFDGIIKYENKQIDLDNKKSRNAFNVTRLKTGWPYLISNAYYQKDFHQKIKLIGDNLIHDIYSESKNFVCDYYSSKFIPLNFNLNSLEKLAKKENIFIKNLKLETHNVNLLKKKNTCYLVLFRSTHEFNFCSFQEQMKKFQFNWIKNDLFKSFKQYQYLEKDHFSKTKFFFLKNILTQLNRQSTLLTKPSELGNWVCRFEQKFFFINAILLSQGSQATKHKFFSREKKISPKILAHLNLSIRPNSFFSNTHESFTLNNIFSQTYQSGLVAYINTDPFFSTNLHSPNVIYLAKKNLIIPSQSPILKNCFFSKFNGEIFNQSMEKYVDLSPEYNFQSQPTFKSSPGALILTSGSSFSFKLKTENRQYQIGNEIYRGVNLGGLKTSKRTGQIIYLTKEMIKCQAIDQFIMSTNSKFFCRNDQLILKNTRLYTDFYPRLQMGDIVQGIPKIEEFFEARRSKKGLPFEGNLHNRLKERFNFYYQYCGYPLPIADRRSITDIQTYIIGSIFKLYSSQGINISDKHLELIVRQMTSKVKVTEYFYGTNWFEIAVLQSQPIVNEYYSRYIIEKIYRSLIRAIPSVWKKTHLFRYVFHYEPIIFGITQASLDSFGFISAASFQETTKILTQSSILQKTDYLKGLKENVVLGHLIPAGTALQTTLKVGTSKPLFKRQQFKTKFSKLLINRCKLESQLKYQSGSYSCHYSYKKAYKYTNPILYLFLYVYCVYYDQPRVL
jgi:hypothetical protein